MDFLEAQTAVTKHGRWHHSFDIFPGVRTPGNYNTEFLWEKLQLDGRLQGRTLLDVGACDGYYTKQAAMAGATVLAVDYLTKMQSGFHITERVSGLTLPHLNCNVYDITPGRVGTFDYVLFLGVLYHLPDMLRALYGLRQVCTSALLLETLYDPVASERAVSTYFKANSLAEDSTNFWVPNRECVHSMLHDVGFDVIREDCWGDRLLIEAAPAPEERKSSKLAYAYK
jgi:tRNA (mo5U34)-methyltransferase